METQKLTRCGARFSNSQKFVVLRWTVKQRTKIQNECIVRPLFGSYNICLARLVIHQINAERLQKKVAGVFCYLFDVLVFSSLLYYNDNSSRDMNRVHWPF